jgi:hypothetical protein
MAEPDDFFNLMFQDLPPDRLKEWVGPLLGVSRWEEAAGFGWYGWDSRVGDLLIQVTPDAEQGCTWVGVSFNSLVGPWPTSYDWACQAARELRHETICFYDRGLVAVRPNPDGTVSVEFGVK